MGSVASTVDLAFGIPRETSAAYTGAVAIWGWNVEVKEFGTKWNTFDREVYQFGNLVGYVEVKSRRNTWNKYPTTVVSLNKVAKAKASDLPIYFVFYFEDRVGYLDPKKVEPVEIKFVGRRDRGGAGTDHAFYPIDSIVWCDSIISIAKDISALFVNI